MLEARLTRELEPQIPEELRARIASVRAELSGDRREVAVLFADLSGFTAMSETMDPEEVGLLVNRLLRELSEPIYRYEGYVDKYIGDAVMALFGAPLAHENDPERAVLAAMGMLEVLERHNRTASVPLALRVGINLGEVIATHLGGGERLQYTVIGDTVNVASRLESKARPNTILVSESLFRRVAHRFEGEELPPLEVKGKAEPLQTFRIAGLRAVATGTGRPHEDFVGREAELQRLERLLDDAVAGAGGALVLEAEPGTGKSRLVQEALSRRTDDLLVVEVAFTPVRLPEQRSPAAELFRQLLPDDPHGRSAAERAATLLGAAADSHRAGLEDLAREADPSAEPVPAASGPSDPAAARQNRWAALAALLRSAASRRPLVLRVEDLHWADEGARELLEFLLPALAALPAAVLLTTRPGAEWIPAEAERLPLAPLPGAAARELLERLLGVDASGARLELVRRAEGNPLFLLELARAVRTGATAGPLPGTLHGLLVSRVDALPADVRLLLQMGSVLGLHFPTRLLRAMYALQRPDLSFDAALRQLESEEFLVAEANGDVSHRFHHALVQEATYAGLLVRMRRVLHESAARIGESLFASRIEAEAPFFAHHFWEAGLRREAAPHLWTAGRQAADRYELHAAERWLERFATAVAEEPSALGPAEVEAAFQETYGLVLLHRGKLDPAAERFSRVEELGRTAGHTPWTARGLEYRGRVAWYAGRLQEARELFESGLRELPEDEGAVAADLHNDLGIALYYLGDAERAFSEHGRALALREALSDLRGTSKSLTNIGNLLFDFRDDLDGAEEHYRRALELAQEVQDRQLVCSSIVNLAGVARDRGKWSDAIRLYERGREMQEETGWSFLGWLILRSQAESELWLARIADALRHVRQLLDGGETVLEPFNRVFVRLLLFDAYVRACADDEAARALEQARALAEELGVAEKEHEIGICEGRLLALRGDWQAAAARFARAEDVAEGIGHSHLAALAAAHRRRAEAHLGTPPAPAAPIATGRPPLDLLIRYLEADARTLGAPSADLAAELGAIGETATAMGNVSQARAAFEREAQVRETLEVGTGREALGRARARAAELLERLPPELRARFASHPRNAALGLAAEGVGRGS